MSNCENLHKRAIRHLVTDWPRYLDGLIAPTRYKCDVCKAEFNFHNVPDDLKKAAEAAYDVIKTGIPVGNPIRDMLRKAHPNMTEDQLDEMEQIT